MLLLFVSGMCASGQILIREYINLTNGQVYARDKVMSMEAFQAIPPPGETIVVRGKETVKETTQPMGPWEGVGLGVIIGACLGAFAMYRFGKWQ